MMRQTRIYLLGLLLVSILLIVGCAAPHLDEAKRQYEMALSSQNPIPYYKAALEELEVAIEQDQNQLQAYALKGLIYRNLEDYDLATQNLEIAKQGSYAGKLQWVPVVINLTYGDIFHGRAGTAMNLGDVELAKSYQETAIEFYNNVITTTFGSLGETTEGDEIGIGMQDLYIKAQGRWAAGKFQMAAIAGRVESKERQSELLREVTTRLSSIVETYPDSTALRYYLADGYRKQALTIRRTDPVESEKLQAKAMAQLRVCAELGLPDDLRHLAAKLFNTLSKGTEPEVEQKILGTVYAR